MDNKSRKLTVYGATGRAYQDTPQIRLQGQWLEAIGFRIGDKIQAACEEKKIIITRLPEATE